MRKIIYSLFLVALLSLTAQGVMANDPIESPKTELTAEQRAQLTQIENRIQEIRNMDKSGLTRAERKALRKELKEMKVQAKAISGGVYLSVGAIIIIILLLILIL